jgi:trans-aconitate 2-methyltransferase
MQPGGSRRPARQTEVSDHEDGPRYTFGDSALATDRLMLLARVFDAPSRAFLTGAVTTPPRLALDLGCGPGATTRLVAEVTRAEKTVGIDTSRAFLAVAATGAPANISFEVHDATRLPLPFAPVDLIYCRLLLAHIADVAAMVAGLNGQLRVGGRLLVDELEWIETSHPVLAAYERVVVDLLASQGAPMYAGPIVDPIRRGTGWRQCSSDVRVVPVATADAAAMFRMNLTTWRDDPHIRAHHDPDEIDQIGRDLGELETSSGTADITWGIRQVVYQRAGEA